MIEAMQGYDLMAMPSIPLSVEESVLLECICHADGRQR